MTAGPEGILNHSTLRLRQSETAGVKVSSYPRERGKLETIGDADVSMLAFVTTTTNNKN